MVDWWLRDHVKSLIQTDKHTLILEDRLKLLISLEEVFENIQWISGQFRKANFRRLHFIPLSAITRVWGGEVQ